jgi:hypothetical protein
MICDHCVYIQYSQRFGSVYSLLVRRRRNFVFSAKPTVREFRHFSPNYTQLLSKHTNYLERGVRRGSFFMKGGVTCVVDNGTSCMRFQSLLSRPGYQS